MPEERFEEKSEPATPRRRQEAREKGQVARSQDLSSAMILLAAVGAMYYFGDLMVDGMGSYMRHVIELGADLEPTQENVVVLGRESLWVLFYLVLPVFLAVFATALAINFVQTGFVASTESLTISLEKLDPIRGLQRIFSLRGVVRLFISMGKIVVIGSVLYLTLSGEWATLLSLMDMDIREIAAYLARLSLLMSLRVSLALLILALLDYGYQRWQHEKDLMMSRQEVKEEMKRLEGDPKIRERRRAIQRQLALQRMMQKVPSATVVITNPEHYSVAVQYDEDMPAPKVVAKGVDYLAQRIREMAKEHGIPLVQNPYLARVLYREVEVDREIPPKLYAAVAEVLAYVYRLRNQSVSFA